MAEIKEPIADVEIIEGASEYDTLTEIVKKLDELLGECSGRQIISASDMADKLLDIRQFVKNEMDKKNEN